MSDKCLMPIKKILDNGAEVIITVPTGGYGHAADEQPLPYIRLGRDNLTPRYGGDEAYKESDYNSLPLPVGKLISKWPVRQRVFNLLRRRVNIYWRNIFQSFDQYTPEFMFARQLKFTQCEAGFAGYSPVLDFSRELSFNKNSVEVVDLVKFKMPVIFEYFEFAQHACFSKAMNGFELISDVAPNVKRIKSSSTGEFLLNAHRLENVEFNIGDTLVNKLVYRVSHEL